MDASARDSWPPLAAAQELFARLLALDPLAPADFTAAYLDLLIAHLRRSNHVDDHFIQEAAEDAILSLLKRPEQYDPTRASLEAYLGMSASGDLRNILRRDGRHHNRREDVEVGDVAGKSPDESDDDLPTFDHPAFAAVIAEFTTDERATLGLMRGGERTTAVFAAALSITDRTPDEQFAEVKRVKDRIKLRLKRAAEGL